MNLDLTNQPTNQPVMHSNDAPEARVGYAVASSLLGLEVELVKNVELLEIVSEIEDSEVKATNHSDCLCPTI